jgi:Ca2+/Na+ antiporter
MIRPDSYWIKAPLTVLIIVVIGSLLASSSADSYKAISVTGAILLLVAYILGIDTTIVNRIIRMKPLSGIINGLYFMVLGLLYLVIAAGSGQFVIVQLVFIVFLCLVGFSILVYQVRKGALTTLRRAEDPKTQSKGIKAMLRKHSVYTYLISIGSDMSVTALFFSVFVLIDVPSAMLYFILGYIVRSIGGFVATRVGAAKGVILAEEA